MDELKPCGGCRRHIAEHERVCRFCGAYARRTRAAAIVGLATFDRVGDRELARRLGS